MELRGCCNLCRGARCTNKKAIVSGYFRQAVNIRGHTTKSESERREVEETKVRLVGLARVFLADWMAERAKDMAGGYGWEVQEEM